MREQVHELSSSDGSEPELSLLHLSQSLHWTHWSSNTERLLWYVLHVGCIVLCYVTYSYVQCLEPYSILHPCPFVHHVVPSGNNMEFWKHNHGFDDFLKHNHIHICMHLFTYVSSYTSTYIIYMSTEYKRLNIYTYVHTVHMHTYMHVKIIEEL